MQSAVQPDFVKVPSLRSRMLFGRRFRVLVSVSAAFPVSATDGEVVYNYRGSIDTANFLGQLFRTLSQVLNLGSSNSNGSRKFFLIKLYKTVYRSLKYLFILELLKLICKQ